MIDLDEKQTGDLEAIVFAAGWGVLKDLVADRVKDLTDMLVDLGRDGSVERCDVVALQNRIYELETIIEGVEAQFTQPEEEEDPGSPTLVEDMRP